MTRIALNPRYIVQRTIYDLTRPHLIKQFSWVALFWVVVAVSILLNIDYLNTAYPNPIRPDDRLLDLFEVNDAFIWVAEIFSSFEVAVVVFILWTRRFKGMPYLLFMMGLMFMMRGFIITLTPLAQIQPPAENYAETHIIARAFYHGMFYSGHTASAFIQAFYFKGHRLRSLIFLLAGVQAIALIISHSHYSIDIVGGLLVAYFVSHFDWMRLVPDFLRDVRWMPWYVTEQDDDTAPTATDQDNRVHEVA